MSSKSGSRVKAHQEVGANSLGQSVWAKFSISVQQCFSLGVSSAFFQQSESFNAFQQFSTVLSNCTFFKSPFLRRSFKVFLFETVLFNWKTLLFLFSSFLHTRTWFVCLIFGRTNDELMMELRWNSCNSNAIHGLYDLDLRFIQTYGFIETYDLNWLTTTTYDLRHFAHLTGVRVAVRTAIQDAPHFEPDRQFKIDSYRQLGHPITASLQNLLSWNFIKLYEFSKYFINLLVGSSQASLSSAYF